MFKELSRQVLESRARSIFRDAASLSVVLDAISLLFRGDAKTQTAEAVCRLLKAWGEGSLAQDFEDWFRQSQ